MYRSLHRTIVGPGSVEIERTMEKEDRFFVKLSMRGTDRRWLLSEAAKAITDMGTDIRHTDMQSAGGRMVGGGVAEVQALLHPWKVMKGWGRVKGILSVERTETFEEPELVLR